MKKATQAILLYLFLCLVLAGCAVQDDPGSQGATTPQTQQPCDHYDMDMDGLCDDCSQSLLPETEPTVPGTEPDYGAAVMRLYVEYTLGAYSSGVTTMMLYDSKAVTVESMVDTTAVGQGEQHIGETGTWSYDAASDIYTLFFDDQQYVLEKNADGLFSVQYSYVMKGQTGGYQDISVFLVEIPAA